VLEWCQDWFHPYYYESSPHQDPPGPHGSPENRKVLRGGCFSNGRNVVRCANRYAEPAHVALNTFTFRCAKDG
jgi:sulfatase modifying factor 1